MRISERLSNLLEKEPLFDLASRSRRYSRHPLRSLAAAGAVRLGRLLGKEIILKGKTFWGRPISVPMPEGSAIYIWGTIDGEEMNLTRFLTNHLKEGSVFADIGAHAGFYSILAADILGHMGEVYSFEPTPRTFHLLQKNTSNFSNIHLVEGAAWKSDGIIELSEFGVGLSIYNSVNPAAHAVAEFRKEPAIRTAVKAVSLDGFFKDRRMPDFIKLDCEGSELEVLHGARSILVSRPTLSIEISDKEEEKFHNIRQFLMPLGYSIYRLEYGNPVLTNTPPSPGTYSNYIFSVDDISE